MKLEDNPRIRALHAKMEQARAELNEALAEHARGDVRDYEFATPAGSVKLSGLFGGRRDLFVVHNMGVGCANCTMYADGLNGFYPHIVDRAALVVSSPDAPEVQAKFAASRGWVFPMVSCRGGSFAADMGFEAPNGAARPGVSAFRMEAGRITRTTARNYLLHEQSSVPWNLFDMLPEGIDGWVPKTRYG